MDIFLLKVNTSLTILYNSRLVLLLVTICICILAYTQIGQNYSSIRTQITNKNKNKENITETKHTSQTLYSNLLKKIHFSPGLELKDGVCSKGRAPWDNTWIKTQIKPFLQVYNRRPGDNHLGSPLMHQFAMWCIVRYLQPLHIIESGIWRGLGTWMFRQAAPNAQLILLDPDSRPDTVYKDTHNDTIYFTGKNFRDFLTMRLWKDVKLDVNRTLAFIDDHHTPFMRIPHARRVGIKHMIFEDNYWKGFYDCTSLKQGCACVMNDSECAGFIYRDAWAAIKHNLTDNDLNKMADVFQGIEIYNEFPMMWNVYRPGLKMISEKSRNYLYSTKDGETFLKDNGLKWLPFKSMLDGSYTYVNIAYVKLKY